MPTYPRGPKAEAFSNAVDVVERLRDPTDPSTERTAPPCSAHVQLDDVPRAPIQQSVGDEFRQHDGVVTVLKPCDVEHQDRHHAVVLTELSLDTRLDRSSRDIIELNVC